jgi:hypothetical protein
MKTAAKYRPKPNTVWFVRVLRQFLRGVRVLDEAMPAPIAGCMTRKGTTTVPMPTASAGSKRGLFTHDDPYMDASKTANAMPSA